MGDNRGFCAGDYGRFYWVYVTVVSDDYFFAEYLVEMET